MGGAENIMNFRNAINDSNHLLFWQCASGFLALVLFWLAINSCYAKPLPDPQGMLVEIARPDRALYVMDSGRARVTFEFEKRDADYVLSLNRSEQYRVQITEVR